MTDRRGERWMPEHVRALDYCTWCPRLCHFACPAALGDASDASSAWGMMTLANLVRRGDTEMQEEVAAQWYRCTSCGRCTEFCRHGNDVAAVLQEARAQAVEARVHPPAIRALDERLARQGGPEPLSASLVSVLDAARAGASESSGRIGLLLECGGLDALGGDGVQRLLALLEWVARRPVVPLQSGARSCCGGVASRAGLETRAAEMRAQLAREAEGYTLVISDCSDAIAHLPRGVAGEPLVVFLARHVERLRERVPGLDGKAVLRHRGCAERRDARVVAAEASLLSGLGVSWRAAPAMDGKDECCGGEEVFRAASPEGARAAAGELWRMLGDEAREEEVVLTSAGRCACAMREGTQGRGGAVSLLALLVAEAART